MKAEGTGYNGAGLPSSIRWQQMPAFMASIRLLNNEFALVTKLKLVFFRELLLKAYETPRDIHVVESVRL